MAMSRTMSWSFPAEPIEQLRCVPMTPPESHGIWWLSSSDPHVLDVPVIGRFENGVGSFYANDVLRGTPIRVRFLWLRTDAKTPRWEQAMSKDGGISWETNWTMDFEQA